MQLKLLKIFNSNSNLIAHGLAIYISNTLLPKNCFLFNFYYLLFNFFLCFSKHCLFCAIVKEKRVICRMYLTKKKIINGFNITKTLRQIIIFKT